MIQELFPDGYYVPSSANTGYFLYIGPGRIQLPSGLVATHGGGWFNPGGTVTGMQQVYVEPTYGMILNRDVTSQSSTFPAGSMPIAILTMDAIGRIQSVTDARDRTVISGCHSSDYYQPNGTDITLRTIAVFAGDEGAP